MTDAIPILSYEVRDQVVVHDLVHEAERHGWAMFALGMSIGMLVMVVVVAGWRYL